jgi:hypothetical protein
MQIIDDTSDEINVHNLQLESFSQKKCIYILLRDMQNLKIMQ